MKDSFIFEGKKYISARRASEISDYASDYVGQLCRAGKLDCRMIGRSWFVTEESIHLHKAAISREEASRSRIENLRGKPSKIIESAILPTTPISTPVTSTSLAIVKSIVASIPTSDAPKEIVTETAIKSPYVYSNDERPLLPVLNKKVSIAKIEKIEKTEKVDLEVKVPEVKVASAVAVAPVASVAPVKSSVKISKKSNPSIFSKKIVTYPELSREIILKRVLAPVFAFVMLFGIGTMTYVVTEKVSNSPLSTKIGSTLTLGGNNVANIFTSVYGSFSTGYKNVVAFFTSPSKLAMNVPNEFGDVTVSEVTPNGIVLSSSSGSPEMDDATKQKIRQSFSDDVTISPDNSGTAGVITPVFKDTKGKDFIYVMVPVKDKDNNVIEN